MGRVVLEIKLCQWMSMGNCRVGVLKLYGTCGIRNILTHPFRQTSNFFKQLSISWQNSHFCWILKTVTNMKFLWFVCFVAVAILGPLAVVAQTDPTIAFEEVSEDQTEASPSVEAVTEHGEKMIVEFDTAEGFTESPENAVGFDITPEKVPEEPQNKTVIAHEVNVTLELPGENNTVPFVGNDIAESISHSENKTEELIPEVVQGTSANVSEPEPPQTGEALDLNLNHTGKDYAHDTIAHYPFNNWTGVGLPPDEVEQFPVNQTEEITHAQEDIIHQLANFTDNEVISDHEVRV